MPRLRWATVSETEWLNTDEAARRLGITTRTLYRFMDKGRLPSYRFGRVFRLKVSDIEAFIDSCRVEPGSLSHLYPEPAGSGSDDDGPARPRSRPETIAEIAARNPAPKETGSVTIVDPNPTQADGPGPDPGDAPNS